MKAGLSNYTKRRTFVRTKLKTFFSDMKHYIYAAVMLLCTTAPVAYAQEELVKYGDFDSWITRTIKESFVVGGKTRTLYEVGPKSQIDGAKAYVNQGGSPWATSNVYAKVCGVVKTNISVYPDAHGSGQCAKLYTHLVTCKAVGVVNISVLAAGSRFHCSVL